MTKKTKNTSERQASFRERKKADGYSELSVWVKNDTLEKITTIADSKGITKGEVIDILSTDNV